MMVAWYMSTYRIGKLPGYVQGYGSSSMSVLDKAHIIGLVPKVSTMD